MRRYPTVCLSIRQPWAWLIIHAGKDIENCTWRTNFRGEFLIQAAKGMTRKEYDVACTYTKAIKPISMPCFEDLERGGIVGRATIINCVDKHKSPWFFGPYGFVLADISPLPFMPITSGSGFFRPKEFH